MNTPRRPRRLPPRHQRRPPLLRWLKITGIAAGSLILAALLEVGGVWLWAGGSKVPPAAIAWGLTFSAGDARGLGLDPQAAYTAMLNDLHPKRLRLVAYWSDIQPTSNTYNYGDLDSQVTVAEQRGIPYVIVVGRKVPRWPECYTPDWAKAQPAGLQRRDLMQFVDRTMRRYDSGPHLLRWQIENEPFLNFGDNCPVATSDQLSAEVQLAHHLTAKPIMVTDSGETSTWLHSSQYPDVLGTTLYRVVLNSKGRPFHHFLPPEFYTRHANLIKKLHPNVKQVIVAELQAEPWTQVGLMNLPHAYIDQTLSHQQFNANIEFARQAGLPEIYFWGAEWWYYEKIHGGDPYYWNQAAAVFAQSAP